MAKILTREEIINIYVSIMKGSKTSPGIVIRAAKDIVNLIGIESIKHLPEIEEDMIQVLEGLINNPKVSSRIKSEAKIMMIRDLGIIKDNSFAVSGEEKCPK